MLSLAAASRSPDHSQLCYINGLSLGEICKESIFHILSWASHKSRKPVRSTLAAELLAASELSDKLISIRDTVRKILQCDIQSFQLIDSKDLFNSLTTQQTMLIDLYVTTSSAFIWCSKLCLASWVVYVVHVILLISARSLAVQSLTLLCT